MTELERRRKAWREGFQAAQNGEHRRGGNHYPIGSEQLAWDKGWITGKCPNDAVGESKK